MAKRPARVTDKELLAPRADLRVLRSGEHCDRPACRVTLSPNVRLNILPANLQAVQQMR